MIAAEDISLCTQRDVLEDRQKKAVISEAPGLAKLAIKKLPAALNTAERTKAAHEEAIAVLESVQIEITAARRTAINGGIAAPIVNPDNFGRLAAQLNWAWSGAPAPRFESNMNIAFKRRQRELCDNDYVPGNTRPGPGPRG